MNDEFNADILNFTTDICVDLNIPIPDIKYDSSRFVSQTQMACVFDGVLYLPEYVTLNPDLFFAIAHELRHIWQLKYHEAEFFTEYKTRKKLSVKEYNMQPAELDAHAYGALIMRDCGLKVLFNGMDAGVIDAIHMRMKDISEKGV